MEWRGPLHAPGARLSHGDGAVGWRCGPGADDHLAAAINAATYEVLLRPCAARPWT